MYYFLWYLSSVVTLNVWAFSAYLELLPFPRWPVPFPVPLDTFCEVWLNSTDISCGFFHPVHCEICCVQPASQSASQPASQASRASQSAKPASQQAKPSQAKPSQAKPSQANQPAKPARSTNFLTQYSKKYCENIAFPLMFYLDLVIGTQWIAWY